MKQVTVTVVDPVGLHARPATVAVNAASKFKSEINVAFKGREVNMKSIMGVMSLGVGQGADVVISAEGADADDALQPRHKGGADRRAGGHAPPAYARRETPETVIRERP